MFIKRETRAEKACAYQMLPSFKTSVTYNSLFNFTLDNCTRCEAIFVGYKAYLKKNVHFLPPASQKKEVTRVAGKTFLPSSNQILLFISNVTFTIIAA